MTKIINKILFAALLGHLLVACAPTKNAAYFSKHKNVKDIEQPDKIYYLEKDTADIIKIGDELYITVASGNDDPNSFNQTMGNASLGIELISYKVDDKGNIRLPYLDKVQVAGKSVSSLVGTLETRLSEYIFLPTVSVRIVNNKVTVLGEVNAPGVYAFNRNTFNIYEVIGQAGDIAPFGNRKNVLIVRHQGDQILKKHVDLTNDEIIASQWYEVQANDIIYVEPLRRRSFGMETFSVFDLFSLITTTYAVYILVDQIRE